MKSYRILLILMSVFLTANMVQSQSASEKDIYPIPGSDLLMQQWQQIDPSIRAKLQQTFHTSLKKTTWSFTVGQTKSWWATNLNSGDAANYNKEYAVPSTCRAVGSNCYIFVEDAIWNTRATQVSIDSMKSAFESRTPADTAKGIYHLDTQYFGNPPNVDGDPKIIILILNIIDGFSGSGGYVAGYFYSINEYSEADVQYYLGSSRHSNEGEIYYIDANPGDLLSSTGRTNAASVTAHEFQHMIHFNYDQNEISFVNEGMSESASVLCGYTLRSPVRYYANANVDFTSWALTSDVLRDYSRTALFSWYLIEQFGSSLTKKIVENTNTGVNGYNAALQSIGSPLRFLDILNNFAVATSLNNKAIDSKYGFTKTVLEKPTPGFSHTTTSVTIKTDTIEPYGTRFIQFAVNSPISVLVNSSGALSINGISTGSNSRVETITKGTAYSPSGFGVIYSSLLVAVTNQSNGKTVYTYQASPATDVRRDAQLNAPSTYLLAQNFPNPFNPTTVISYQIPVTSYISIKVFDLLGKEITTLADDVKEAGNYEVKFDASKLASGVYFYKIQAGNFTSVKKLVLMK